MNPPATPDAPASGLGLVLDPLVPVPLVGFLALLVGALTLWVYLRTAARLSPLRRWILLLLRLGGVALVLLILLQPSRQERLPSERRDKFTLVAVDASRSMRQTDSGRRSRLDAARELLWESGAVPRRAGEPPPAEIRLLDVGPLVLGFGVPPRWRSSFGGRVEVVDACGPIPAGAQGVHDMRPDDPRFAVHADLHDSPVCLFGRPLWP